MIINDIDFSVKVEDFVKFYEHGHIYKNEKTSKLYTSVTTLLGRYKADVNWEYWVFYKALEKLCEERGDMTPLLGLKAFVREKTSELGDAFQAQSVGRSVFLEKNRFFKKEVLLRAQADMQEIWDKNKIAGQERGTEWHKKEEEKALYIDKVFYGNEFVQLSTDYTKLKGEKIKLHRNIKDGAYVELLLSHPLIEIGGQADQIIIQSLNQKRYMDIGDWKTDKRIDMFNKYKTKLKDPVSHLDDCNYVKYCLQLSFYMWIGECHGFIPRNMSIAHIRNGRIKPYKIPYLKEEIKAIIWMRYLELMAAA